MISIEIISKVSNAVVQRKVGNIAMLTEDSVVKLGIKPDDIAEVRQERGKLIIVLKSGEMVVLDNFFDENCVQKNSDSVSAYDDNNVVLQGEEPGQLVSMKVMLKSGDCFSNVEYEPISNISAVLPEGYGAMGKYSTLIYGGVIGAALVGVGVAIANSKDDDDDSSKHNKPEKPTATVAIANYRDDVGPFTTDADKKNGYETKATGTYTNDNSPQLNITVSGKGVTEGKLDSNGDKVVVYRQDANGNPVKVGEATWNAKDKTYQFTDKNLADSPKDDPYVYTVRVENGGGEGAKSGEFKFFVDTTAPTAKANIVDFIDDQGQDSDKNDHAASGSITNDTAPVLNISVNQALGDGEVVAVYRTFTDAQGNKSKEERVGTATLKTGYDTAYTYTAASIGDGKYEYTARVEDQAGNQGVSSGKFDITQDTKAPTTAISKISYTDDVSPITGEFDGNKPTNDKNPLLNITVNGKVEADEVVAVYRDNVKLGNATLKNGVYQYHDNSNLSDGSYNYSVRIEDKAGNQGPAKSMNLTVDTTAPTSQAVITGYIDDVGADKGEFASGTTTDDSSPVFKVRVGSLNSGESVVLYRDDGDGKGYHEVYRTNTSYTSGVYECADGGLQNGKTYNYIAKVVDSAGNEGPVSSTFKISVSGASAAAASMKSASAASNQNDLESTAQDDAFTLNPIGHETLIYKLLNNTDALGGNGHDTVNNFSAGNSINISALLADYHNHNGGDLSNYLSITHENGNSTLHIDRDGSGTQYQSESLMTFNQTDTTLEQLLANNQLIV